MWASCCQQEKAQDILRRKLLIHAHQAINHVNFYEIFNAKAGTKPQETPGVTLYKTIHSEHGDLRYD